MLGDYDPQIHDNRNCNITLVVIGTFMFPFLRDSRAGQQRHITETEADTDRALRDLHRQMWIYE